MKLILVLIGFAIGVFFGPTKTVYQEHTTVQCPSPIDNSIVFKHGKFMGKKEWGA